MDFGNLDNEIDDLLEEDTISDVAIEDVSEDNVEDSDGNTEEQDNPYIIDLKDKMSLKSIIVNCMIMLVIGVVLVLSVKAFSFWSDKESQREEVNINEFEDLFNVGNPL